MEVGTEGGRGRKLDVEGGLEGSINVGAGCVLQAARRRPARTTSLRARIT
jgi:hypothetical protein